MSADVIDLTHILALRAHVGVANDDGPIAGEITVIERYYVKRIEAIIALFAAVGAQA